jgi:hypothetical protein
VGSSHATGRATRGSARPFLLVSRASRLGSTRPCSMTVLIRYAINPISTTAALKRGAARESVGHSHRRRGRVRWRRRSLAQRLLVRSLLLSLVCSSLTSHYIDSTPSAEPASPTTSVRSPGKARRSPPLSTLSRARRWASRMASYSPFSRRSRGSASSQRSASGVYTGSRRRRRRLRRRS